MWDYYINLYVHSYCLGRGLAKTTLVAYELELDTFADYMINKELKDSPSVLKMGHIHSYTEYLRKDKQNSNWAVNRSVGVIKGFCKYLVAKGILSSEFFPIHHFPKMKRGYVKVRDVLSKNEIKKLLKIIPNDTVVGLRDKAIIYLLYSTGIRASECEGLKLQDVDLDSGIIKVKGKGGDERSIPLVKESIRLLKRYKKVRGETKSDKSFFRTRLRTGVTRKCIYDRLKKYMKTTRIFKRISPHNLRHTFAKHAVDSGMNIVNLRDLLGHRSIASTQRYLQTCLNDLRKAVDEIHPVKDILTSAIDYLPDDVRLNYQRSPG
ncbi:MAG: tyrosine-type recombinase/integrase [Bacteriovoracaceae bacterium]|jgi:site-specific recombinase XerD|nr:tyrosine-type recombinase/integrase [Bacteriovoracaceae bacterium]